MSDVVYHFTDTAHLPWIVETGELRPGLNRISKLPFDFLWATTNPDGDRTCSVQNHNARTAYRSGLTQLVRFTLPGEAFSQWRDVSELYPEWTPDFVARAERLATKLGETKFDNWRIRRDLLPITSALVVEAKSYKSNRWLPIDATLKAHVRFPDGECGIIIGGRVYVSQKITVPNGAVGYAFVGICEARL
jgi:hypothetical protein